MTIAESHNAPWTRMHDSPDAPLIAKAPTIAYPQSLQELVAVVTSRQPGQNLKAAGSHWGLSDAAISDNIFIETNDPNSVFTPPLGATLYEVVPGCLSTAFLDALQSDAPPSYLGARSGAPPAPYYYVHAEAGKRIYQLYAELDTGDAGDARSLNYLLATTFNQELQTAGYAFGTLGGAGGQTIVGALTTGTHGGDFDRGAIADCVVAMHIVADGGMQYWIERDVANGLQMTDDAKLQALYGGPDVFQIIRDPDVFAAAMVQVGRFGAIYSVVIQVSKQYGLYQEVRYDTWNNVKDNIASPLSSLYDKVHSIQDPNYPSNSKKTLPIPQQFLQIAINLPAVSNETDHAVAVTRRWTVPTETMLGNEGRAERVGKIVMALDPRLNAPRYSEAGKSVGYSPDGNGTFNTFDFACASGDFVTAILEGLIIEIENYAVTHAITSGGILAGVVAIAETPGLDALLGDLLALLEILAALVAAIVASGQTRLGQVLNDVRAALLGPAATRGAGILLWEAIAAFVFKTQQPESSYKAFSYAIMDTHNYMDVSCQNYGQSVEVFFDAADPNLICFVDRLLQFEHDQEWNDGRAAAGYISLRFCGQTQATIGPEQFDRTVAIECSALADVNGGSQFVDYAVSLALDPNIKGILHWGQQNSSTQADTEFRFGDAPGQPSGPLFKWRSALSKLTANGRLDGFSSAFTRQTGLEIVQPIIAAFELASSTPPPAPSWTFSWNCMDNPPATVVTLGLSIDGGVVEPLGTVPLNGSYDVTIGQPFSTFTITLTASLATGGVVRTDTRSLVMSNDGKPIITSFTGQSLGQSLSSSAWSFNWDCTTSPPGTTVALDLLPLDGVTPQHFGGLPLSGAQTVTSTQDGGTFNFMLTASLLIDGVTLTDSRTLQFVNSPIVR